MSSPVVSETAPQARRYHALVIRFVLGRGLVADRFPERTLITTEMLATARAHQGVIHVQGAGRIGTKVTFSLANGRAIYELTDRAVTAEGVHCFVAQRRAMKVCVAGRPVETPLFRARDLGRLADTWPGVIALADDLVHPPPELRCHVRVQNLGTPAARIVFSVPEAKAVYTIFGRHPGRDAWLAERLKLKTPQALWTRIPTATTSVGIAVF